jgi:predicted thioredoxin/glutaredoxin
MIVAIILAIYLVSNGANKYTPEPKVAICIAMKSELYISKTCSHCQQQINILNFKNYSSFFKMVDCIQDQQICLDKSIFKVPIWVIANKTYEGVKSWEELKNLTGC